MHLFLNRVILNIRQKTVGLFVMLAKLESTYSIMLKYSKNNSVVINLLGRLFSPRAKKLKLQFL